VSTSVLLLRPEGWAFLLLAPAVWLFLRTRERARAKRMAGVLGPRVSEIAEVPQRRRRRVRNIAFALALLLAGLAALGPSAGAAAGDLEWRGVDLVLCLDVSRSMLAGDLVPDRLTRAKEQIRELAAITRGDRLALVVFAGEARLAVPLTRDGVSLGELADLADPTSVGKGGTDLGAALDVALDALQAGDGRPRAIVLLTDGEDLAGRGARAAATCRERGVVVHGVGFGTEDGSRIAIGGGRSATFVRDREGREVVSALDSAGLTRIADITGGRFVTARSGARPLPALYEDDVLPTARAGHVRAAGRREEDRFQWPLLLAWLLFMVDSWLVDRIRR